MTTKRRSGLRSLTKQSLISAIRDMFEYAPDDFRAAMVQEWTDDRCEICGKKGHFHFECKDDPRLGWCNEVIEEVKRTGAVPDVTDYGYEDLSDLFRHSIGAFNIHSVPGADFVAALHAQWQTEHGLDRRNMDAALERLAEMKRTEGVK